MNLPDGTQCDPRAPWNEKEEQCPSCRGMGIIYDPIAAPELCGLCDGSGEITSQQEEEFYQNN